MVRSKAPFLLTVMAEEMGSLINESNTTTTIDIALMIEDETNDPPEFNQDRYLFSHSDFCDTVPLFYYLFLFYP